MINCINNKTFFVHGLRDVNAEVVIFIVCVLCLVLGVTCDVTMTPSLPRNVLPCHTSRPPLTRDIIYEQFHNIIQHCHQWTCNESCLAQKMLIL